MNVRDELREKAAKLGRTVILPEGGDERTIKAALILKKEGIAEPVIVGTVNSVKDAAKGADISSLRIIYPEDFGDRDIFIKEHAGKRALKGVSFETAKEEIMNELNFGAMLLKKGYGDIAVAGAVNTTADVLRAGLRILGTKEGIRTVSSFFLMILPNGKFGKNGALFFADCAVIPDPTPEQLADIASATAENAKKLLDLEPRVAFLSFSTKGSAVTSHTEKIVNAVNILKNRTPGFLFDGEMQADAALVEEVGLKKAKGSPVAGKANVLIFPDLNSGNIGYKLVQRLAGAMAFGPILQGFSKPLCDLSRGCSAEDIVDTAAVCALMS